MDSFQFFSVYLSLVSYLYTSDEVNAILGCVLESIGVGGKDFGSGDSNFGSGVCKFGFVLQ